MTIFVFGHCTEVLYLVLTKLLWTKRMFSLVLGIRWSKAIVGQVDLTAKLCLSFCLELQSAKSTYQHVDLDL